MNFEKVRKYADLVVLIIGSVFLAYLFLRHLLIYLLPFLIGWFVAFAVRPPARYLSGRVKLKERYIRLILTLLLYLTLGAVITVAVWLLSREIWELLAGLGEVDSVREFISGLTGTDGLFGRIFGDFSDYVADLIYRVAISSLTAFGTALSAVVSAVPKTLFFLLITVVASAYFSLGLEDINAAVKRLLPSGVLASMIKFKDGFLGALFKYARSYLLLLVITFLEMLIGLFALRAPYPVIMALVIALLDLLPVIGVGFVLIPWGVWSLTIGKRGFGVGLLVIFVLHTVLRQTIEPKIVGKNLGVHPLLTLIFIYVGYSLCGIVGLLLVPILTVSVNIAFGKKDSAKISERSVGEGNDT